MSHDTNTKIESLWKKFSNRLFRQSFSNAQLSAHIAAQIQTMREDRGWTQQQLAEATGMAQSRISLLEDPTYDRMSITTLKRIAEALDVGLRVHFVPYSDVLKAAVDPAGFTVKGFADDTVPLAASSKWMAQAVVHTAANGGRPLIITSMINNTGVTNDQFPKEKKIYAPSK